MARGSRGRVQFPNERGRKRMIAKQESVRITSLLSSLRQKAAKMARFS